MQTSYNFQEMESNKLFKDAIWSKLSIKAIQSIQNDAFRTEIRVESPGNWTVSEIYVW